MTMRTNSSFAHYSLWMLKGYSKHQKKRKRSNRKSIEVCIVSQVKVNILLKSSRKLDSKDLFLLFLLFVLFLLLVLLFILLFVLFLVLSERGASTVHTSSPGLGKKPSNSSSFKWPMAFFPKLEAQSDCPCCYRHQELMGS